MPLGAYSQPLSRLSRASDPSLWRQASCLPGGGEDPERNPDASDGASLSIGITSRNGSHSWTLRRPHPAGWKPAATTRRRWSSDGVRGLLGSCRQAAPCAGRSPGSGVDGHSAGRALRAPLFLALAALAVHAWPALGSLLEYDRAGLAQGELWRLVTCHFTHWSWEHALLDALVLAVVGGVYALRGGQRLLPCIAAAAVVIPSALWLVVPEMVRYRGLSGIDAAVTALLAVAMIRSSRRPVDLLSSLLAVAGLAAKICFELWSGQAAFVDSTAAGFVPVPLAHLLGGVTGAVVALLPWRRPRPRARARRPPVALRPPVRLWATPRISRRVAQRPATPRHGLC